MKPDEPMEVQEHHHSLERSEIKAFSPKEEDEKHNQEMNASIDHDKDEDMEEGELEEGELEDDDEAIEDIAKDTSNIENLTSSNEKIENGNEKLEDGKKLNEINVNATSKEEHPDSKSKSEVS